MQRIGRIVGVAEGWTVIARAPMRTADNLQRIRLWHGLEANPGIAPVHPAPRQIGRVLVPERARADAACLEEDLLGEIPDVLRTPKFREQLPERHLRPHRIELRLGCRIAV